MKELVLELIGFQELSPHKERLRVFVYDMVFLSILQAMRMVVSI